MAINPQLLAMLMQSAPMLLSALQKPYNAPGEFFDGDSPLDESYGNVRDLTNLANRGYDMGLVQDDMLKDFNGPHVLDDWNMTDSAAYVLDKTSRAANMSDLPNTKFPSNISGLGQEVLTEVLDDDGYNYLKNFLPAAASANTFANPNNMKTLAQKLLTAKKPGLK